VEKPDEPKAMSDLFDSDLSGLDGDSDMTEEDVPILG
jgi:hypothetical protein